MPLTIVAGAPAGVAPLRELLVERAVEWARRRRACATKVTKKMIVVAAPSWSTWTPIATRSAPGSSACRGASPEGKRHPTTLEEPPLGLICPSCARSANAWRRFLGHGQAASGPPDAGELDSQAPKPQGQQLWAGMAAGPSPAERPVLCPPHCPPPVARSTSVKTVVVRAGIANGAKMRRDKWLAPVIGGCGSWSRGVLPSAQPGRHLGPLGPPQPRSPDHPPEAGSRPRSAISPTRPRG